MWPPNERDHVELRYNKKQYDPSHEELFSKEASRCQDHTRDRQEKE